MARVLVVDDEPKLGKLVAEALELEGHTLTRVEGGRAALQALVRERFDVVVTDLRMPEMGGRELVARLRDEGGALPVVLVSGYSDETATSDGAPAERALEKPFTGEALLQALDAARTRHAAG